MQMLIWVSLAGAGLTFAGSILALFVSPESLGVAPDASQEAMMEAAGVTLPTIPISLVVWFLLFFIGGYLIYASLFASVGAAVEQMQDAQNLLYVVLVPLFIPIMTVFLVIEAPNNIISVILSYVPFFSPVLMPVRMVATPVPIWESALAFLLLAGGFITMMWVASRIYRVGIFMYGKAASIGEIVRWATKQH
jgi:ABC-2 type transport system permease protein